MNLLKIHMIAVKISDGLGNQLFQYAAGYSLAKHRNSGLILDHTILDTNPLRTYELDQLSLKYDKVYGVNQFPTKPLKVLARFLIQKTVFSSYKVVQEKEAFSYDETIFDHNEENLYLNGYWQDYRYFDAWRKELAGMISPSFAMSSYAKEMTERIRSSSESVSVHVRRGDYVGKSDVSLDYYKEAVSLMNQKLKNPLYFFFSDDPEYVRNAFGEGENIILIENPSSKKSVEDFLLMKTCGHHIIANSSYSWWAAYGAVPGIVTAPIYRDWKRSFYPEDWITMEM